MWFPCSSFPLKMAYDFGNYKLLRNSVDGNLMLFQDKASVFKFIPRSLDQPKSFSWWRSRWERCRALLKLPIWCCVRWEKVLPARQFILTFFLLPYLFDVLKNRIFQSNCQKILDEIAISDDNWQSCTWARNALSLADCNIGIYHENLQVEKTQWQ